MYVIMTYPKIFKRRSLKDSVYHLRKKNIAVSENAMTAKDIFSGTCHMSQITVYFSLRKKKSVYINRSKLHLYFVCNREFCTEVI